MLDKTRGGGGPERDGRNISHRAKREKERETGKGGGELLIMD